jgi:hypothetical protein
MRLLETQGGVTVMEMLPGSSEWLKLRLECVGDEKVGPAVNRLPVVARHEPSRSPTLRESALKAY